MAAAEHNEATPCLANYNALRRQLAVLERFQGETDRWSGLLDRLLDEEMACRDVDPGGRVGRQQFALLDNGPNRSKTPVVAGEIVVEYEIEQRDSFGEILERYGFQTIGEPVGGRNEEPFVERFRTDFIDIDLAAVLGEINAIDDEQNVTATPNVLRLMNVVTKSKSGPEPACCPPVYVEPEPMKDGDPGCVFVLDTGRFLDGHRETWLRDVDGDPDPRIGPGGYLNLSAGHGTFIAGVIRQVAPTATIEVLRVIGAAGFVEDSVLADTIRAVGDRIGKDGHGVINLSLGYEDHGETSRGMVRQALLDLPPGVAVVCAAGNDNSGREIYPAAFSGDPRIDNVAAVASLDRNGFPSKWSNRGDWVTFSAVGEGIVSTYLEGRERPGTGADDDPYDPEPDMWVGPTPWAVWTGTSFAAPQISALLAERLAGGGTAPDAIAGLRNTHGGDEAAIPGFGVRVPRRDGLTIVEIPSRPDGDPGPQP